MFLVSPRKNQRSFPFTYSFLTPSKKKNNPAEEPNKKTKKNPTIWGVIGVFKVNNLNDSSNSSEIKYPKANKPKIDFKFISNSNLIGVGKYPTPNNLTNS
jgi:hypothetical protein